MEASYGPSEELAEVAERLGKNFDGLLILATRREAGGTRTVCKEAGNFYARYGLAREYVIDAEEKIRREAKADEGP